MGRTEKLGLEEIVDQLALELGLVPADNFDNLRPERGFSTEVIEPMKAGKPASSAQTNRIHSQLISNDQRIVESLAGMIAAFAFDPPQWWEPCDGKPFDGGKSCFKRIKIVCGFSLFGHGTMYTIMV